ncbi:MAG: hybrid sensor histidine kinase/response regulator [Candidatus Heimdallarchaeota archaeon]|nr:hybrid sensor histidine kinase/response regulator [Candidatus Heimdallarchaeota archaeon]
MSSELADHEEFVDILREKITKIMGILCISLGSLTYLTSLIVPANNMIVSLGTFILGISIIILLILNKNQLAMYSLIYGLTIIMSIGAWICQSAQLFIVVTYLYILATIYKMRTTVKILIIYSISFIFLMLFTGRYTFKQTLIQPENIALVNNIQVLIGLVVFSVGISNLMYLVFVRTIEIQKMEYQQLNENQELIISQAQLDTSKLIAGGLAHDFNNILSIIQGNISLIKEKEELEADLVDALNEINMATNKATNLSNQMLNIVKDTRKHQQIININDLVEKTSKFSLRGRKSRYIVDFDTREPRINGDYSSISQVVQNLVLNADQANEGGIIQLKTNLVVLDNENEYSLQQGKYVQVKVIDEGPGIIEDNMEKLFTLFFTTKEFGSGIGLAISKKIIENHKGFIGVSKRTGDYTEFFFLIPVVSDTSDTELQNQEYITNLDKTIVLYDDDRNLLKILEKMLERFGANIFSSSESNTLFDYLQEKKVHVDIFILDLTLPGDKSGIEILPRLKELYPNAYFISTSGYSERFMEMNFSNYGFDDFLPKPFDYSHLNEILLRYLNFS